MKPIVAIVPVIVLVAALAGVLVFLKPTKAPAPVIVSQTTPVAVPVTPEPSPTPLATPTPIPTPDMSVSRLFSGTLPCADCSGLLTELTLTQADTNATAGTFTLKETYVGRSVDPLQTTGKWTTLLGTPTDKNATVYQITPDQSDAVTYYLKTGDTTIKQLDSNQQVIKTRLNYTLKLVVSTLSPEAQKLVGVWRSTTDIKYTREFKADGTLTDSYAGTPPTITGGTWKQVIDTASEPFTFPAVGAATFIKVTVGTETFYFAVGATTTADHLTLMYLDGKGNLEFSRLK